MKARQKGVAAIELAIVLPLLLAIFLAVTEFGRAIYTYNTIAKSARGAARYLTTQNSTDPLALDRARNLIAYGNPSGSGTPLVPGLDSKNTSSKVVINRQTIGASPAINMVTVTITGYQFNPVMDLLGFTRFYTKGVNSITSITFGDISVRMRQES